MRSLALRLATPLLLAALTVRAEGTGNPVALGSPDFRPTPERPFGWRGDGTGRFPGATPPTEWSETKNVRWTATVGKSYSSPVVADPLVIVTSEPDLVVALDRASGREKWKVRVTPADLTDPEDRAAAAEYKPKDTGMAAATPLTDGAAVYVVFASGIVRAFGLDGSPKWTAFVKAPQNTSYGRSASPILSAGKLIVHMTHLYAFDPATGRQLWANAESRCAYGTPAALRSAGVDLLVTPAGDLVRADDGKTVNSQLGAGSNSSPVVADGVIYFGEKDVRAIRLGAEFKDESVWNGEIPNEVFGSPLLHGGLLLNATGAGCLYAFDAGKKGSVEPLIDARPLFGEDAGQNAAYASLTLAGNYLYLVSNTGDIVVLEATREAKRVARNKLKNGSGASPVFSGRDLFLRDGDRLFCIASAP
jgi:outer membrane protein assembly factor BamB